MRPVHVRLARRTRGHALVIMLSYKIVQELARRWSDIDATVQEGLDELKTLCATQLLIRGKPLCNCIPTPRASVQRLLEKARVVLPAALPHTPSGPRLAAYCASSAARCAAVSM